MVSATPGDACGITPVDVRVWLAHRERERSREAVAHYHACPGCYEYHACVMPCTIEHDLGAHRGAPLGSHCLCDRCERAGVES